MKKEKNYKTRNIKEGEISCDEKAVQSCIPRKRSISKVRSRTATGYHQRRVGGFVKIRDVAPCRSRIKKSQKSHSKHGSILPPDLEDTIQKTGSAPEEGDNE